MSFENQYATHFLLAINSNLGPIFYLFRDMTSFPLKTHIFPAPFHSTSNVKLFRLH